MRQGPTIAIIGDGKVATHFTHYLTLLNIPFLQWSRARNSSAQLAQILAASERVLILIGDSAIESFIIDNAPFLNNKTLIHFSGRLFSAKAIGMHPLMTFVQQLYDLETYRKIPFIIDKPSMNFVTLFPELSNPFFYIDSKDKAFYHSLCVMSGNFTCLLWKKFFDEIQDKFNLPKQVGYLYLEQTLKNLMVEAKTALTGPLERGDTATIAANLAALENDPFQKIYQAFVNLYLNQEK